MDQSDITNAEFALDKDQGVSNLAFSQYIFIGLGLLLVVSVAIYMYTYSNGKKRVHFSEPSLDCEGGFCTINKSRH